MRSGSLPSMLRLKVRRSVTPRNCPRKLNSNRKKRQNQVIVLYRPAAFACAIMLMPFPITAFAQSGSTGGTLGKTDKSISGERHDQIRPPPAAGAKDGSCGRIVGTWKWESYTITINRDGTAHHTGGGDGTWTCKDGQYVFVWSIGITDHVSLSTDGNSIAGHNNFGTFSGTRF